MTERTARCSCGETVLRVEGAPDFAAICACGHCRSRTGSAFGMSAYYARERVIEIAGQPTVYTRLSENGRPVDYRFCPICGVTVWWEAAFLPDKIGIAGSLFEDGVFEPSGAYFCADLLGFVGFPPGLPIAEGATGARLREGAT